MVGKLDKPLGVQKPKTKSGFDIRYLVYFLLAIIIGGFGYFVKGASDPAPNQLPDTNGDPQIIASGADIDKTTGKRKGLKKRPDLPIDNNSSGLEEIDINVPTIIPRRRPENIRKRQTLPHIPDPELIEKTAEGSLPVKSPDGLRPLDVYSRQPDTEGNFGVARIVLIVGGLGISQTSTQQAISTLPAGVTLAFAPYGNSLTRWMQTARKGGHELLMQIPMEPFGYPQTSAGKYSLLSSADTQENSKNLHLTLGRITNYVGVMNYLGGKMMTSPQQLTPILEELSERGLMFVDDGSVRNSMAKELAKSANLPFSRSHMIIDSIRTRSGIGKKLKLLETKAKQTGLAIGVASAFPESISQIANFLKNAKSRGLELTPVSAIATEPKG